MIWDCFMFRNELDMLECRLTELEGKVDYHILVEAGMDFRGRKRVPLYGLNESRFLPWRKKIIAACALTLPDDPNPWVREHALRDVARPYIEGLARPDDLVLLCDVDEIPSDEALAWQGQGAAGLLMRTGHSAVDWLYPQPMPASVMIRAGKIAGRPLGQIRDMRSSYPQIGDGGWHLSWLGGPEAQTEKLSVSCHLELPDHELETISSGAGYRDGAHMDVQMVAADVDDSWPRYIRERRCPESWFRPR